MINLQKNTLDLDLFSKVLKAIKDTDRTDIIDSFSDNQFKSKIELLRLIDSVVDVNNNTNVTIWGCWFGSILVPVLAPKVASIIMIDLDDEAIRIGKNKLFSSYTNVSWSTGDVFEKWRGDIPDTDLLINTSCEHMRPMAEWPNWDLMKAGMKFAFQSNNMFHIDEHTNCVNSIQEFKDHLPDTFCVENQSEITDERGTRYTIVGRLL